METVTIGNRTDELIQRYGALIGEVAWHTLTVDKTIQEVSDQHFEEIRRIIEQHIDDDGAGPLRILEVASYAHTTGYRLAEELGARVTLFDISSNTLKLGRQCAGYDSDCCNPRLVSGDFHSLPFQDGCFDLVYIYSALHHTWKWQTVLAEMQRLLGPGGLLFLGNEPVRRACCFYLFRTNRINDFTPFEQRLKDLGIIRTVAEPYLGSRAETLFGMVENQKIPLREFTARLNAMTPVITTTFTPEICMGDLENSWLSQAHLGVPALAQNIRRDLESAVRSAEPALDTVSLGLGFGLPETEDIDGLAKDVAGGIAELPPRTSETSYRARLSEIFGAAVRVIARKPGRRTEWAGQDFKREYECRDGVYVTFDDDIRGLVLASHSSLPDIRISSREELTHCYHSSDWELFREGVTGGRLTLAHQPGRISLPPSGEPRILIANLSASRIEKAPGRLSICQGGREIYSRLLWRPESFLCVAEVKPSELKSLQQLEVRYEQVPPSDPPTYLDNAIHLYHARLIATAADPVLGA